MTTIKEQYHGSMTIKEAVKLTVQTLKNVMEEKICTDNVEVVVIPVETKQMKKLDEQEI